MDVEIKVEEIKDWDDKPKWKVLASNRADPIFIQRVKGGWPMYEIITEKAKPVAGIYSHFMSYPEALSALKMVLMNPKTKETKAVARDRKMKELGK